MRSGLVILAFLAAALAGTLHAQVQQTQRTKPGAAAQKKATSKPATKADNDKKTIPQILQERFDIGLKAEKQGDLIRAESEYRQVLGIALEELGSVYENLDELDKAAAAYQAATEARANSTSAILGLGLVCLQKGDYERGAEAVKLLIAQQRTNPAARSLLGKLYLGMERFDAAVQELEEARKWAPDDQETKLALASTYLRQKRPERAEALFADMLKALGDSPQLRILFGIVYFENEYVDKTIQQFKHAASLDPNYPRVHYYLGLALVSQDGYHDTEAAIKEFQEELTRRPNDYLANYMLGLVYTQERRNEEAVPHLEKAVAAEPAKPDPQLYLGQALYLSRQQEASVPHLLKAIELTTDPSRNQYQIAKAHYQLGQYYNRQGNRDEAKRHIDLAANYKTKAAAADQKRIQSYLGGMGGPNDLKTQASSVQPSVLTTQHNLNRTEKEQFEAAAQFLAQAAAKAYNQLGLLRAGQSDFGRAAQLLSRAAQWGPDLPDIYFNVGLAYYKAQNYKEAIAPLEKAREQQPQRNDVQLLLGMSYFFADEYNKAGRILTPIVAAGNEDPMVLYALGVSHAYAGSRETGMRILQDLGVKYPGVADIHVGLGLALSLDANFQGADAEFAKASELDPKLPEAHYQRGLILIRLRRDAEAAEEFRRELGLNPSHAKAAYHLGYTLSALDKSDDAIQYLTLALRLDPSYAEAYYELGKAQLKKGLIKESIESLENSAKLGGNRSYVQYQLSQAYRRAGKAEEAQAVLQGTDVTAEAKKKDSPVQIGPNVRAGDPRADRTDPRYDPRLDPSDPSYDPMDPRNRRYNDPRYNDPNYDPRYGGYGRPGIIVSPRIGGGGGGGSAGVSQFEKQLIEKDFSDKAHSTDPIDGMMIRDRFLYFLMSDRPVTNKGFALRLPKSKGIPEEVILKF